MALRMFKIKELVENKTVVLKYIETSRQVADLLTKSLGRVAFERLRDDLTGYLAYEYPLGNIHQKHKMRFLAWGAGNPKSRHTPFCIWRVNLPDKSPALFITGA